MAENCAAWPAFTWPLMTMVVPLAVARLCRAARGSAEPLKVASAAARAAATTVVSAAATITSR
jgi:hypothetical protein